MRLLRAHIDRFGILADQDIPGLSPGCNIFLGMNEAGKSTTLQFFRAMFFGYTRGRSQLDPCAADNKKQGTSGGSLFLHSDTAGPLTLVRRPAAKDKGLELYRDQGVPMSEAEFFGLIGHLTPDVFDHVFALSLNRIMDNGSLKEEAVRHALHAAAFGLGSVSPAEVIRQLENKADSLLKRHSVNVTAPINNLINSIEELHQRIQEIGEETARYETLTRQLSHNETTRLAMSKSLAVLVGQQQKTDRLLQAWPRYEALLHIRGRLAGLRQEYNPENHLFSPDALSRFEALQQQEGERQTRCRALFDQQRALQAEMQALAPKLPLAQLVSALGSLREQLGHRKTDASILPQLDQKLHNSEATQQENLDRLGWTHEQLIHAEASLQEQQTIGAAHETFSKLQQELALLRHEQDKLRQEQALLEATLQQDEQSLAELPELPSPLEAEQMAAHLAQAESALASQPRLASQTESRNQEVRQSLAAIHPDWVIEDLETIGTSVQAKNQYREEAEQLLFAKMQHTRADEEAKRLAAAVEQETGEYELMCASLPAPTERITEQTLEGRISDAHKLERCRYALVQIRERHEEAEADLADAIAPMYSQQSKASALASPYVAIGILLLCASAGFAALDHFRQVADALYIAAGCGGTALLFFLLHIIVARSATMQDLETETAAEQRAKARRKKVAEQKEQLEAELDALLRRIGEWSPFALEQMPEENDIARLSSVLERQKNTLQQQQRDLQNASLAEQRLAMKKEELARAQNLRTQTGVALEEQRARWQACLQELRIDPNLPPEELPALFERIETAIRSASAFKQSLSMQEQTIAPFGECLSKALALPFFASAILSPDQLDPATDPRACAATLKTLSARLSELHQLREAERDIRTKASLLEEKKKRVQALQQQDATLQERITRLQGLIAEKKERWQHWLTTRHLAPSLTPETAKEAFTLIFTLKKQTKEIAEMRQEQEAKRASLAQYLTDIAVLAQSAGVPLPTGIQVSPPSGDEKDTMLQYQGKPEQHLAAMLHVLETLTTLVEEAHTAKLRHMSLHERETALQAELATVQAELVTTQELHQKMLHDSGTTSGEAFRHAYALWQQYETARHQEREQLAALSPLGSELHMETEQLVAHFSGLNRDELQQQLADLTEQRDEQTQELKHLDIERGRFEESLRQLTEGAGSAALLQQEAYLQEQVATKVREWRIYTLAHRLMLNAKKRVEQSGQQGVIGMASSLFREITEGEYAGICTGDNDMFMAIHKNGVQKEADSALSQGTKEQLYLALRLAYIQNHAANAEAVPVFMDDLLVNADPVRTQQIANALAHFALTNQILYFTCHPATAEVLHKAALNATAGASAAAPRQYSLQSGTIQAF